VWSDYKRTGRLKDNTAKGYWKALNRCIPDWLDLPVMQISKNDVEERHRKLSEKAPYFADQVMRIVKALFTFAIHKYELDWTNPTQRLSDIRAWHRKRRRTTYIEPHQMKAWFDGVMALDNVTYRNFLLFLMLTGCRRREATLLKWTEVDLDGGTITFLDTKNGDSVKLPVSRFLHSLLKQQRTLNPLETYVFPGQTGEGHISIDNQGHAIASRLSGLKWTPHDARRSFSSVADSLDIPLNVIKKLLNHRSNDVTEGYIQRSLERLRKPIEAITNEILRMAEREELSSLSEALAPRPRVPRGVLEVEILTHMNLSSKDHFSIRDIWQHICHKRKITYDTARFALRRLSDCGYVKRVMEKPLLIYRLPDRNSGGPVRIKPFGGRERDAQKELHWKNILLRQQLSGLTGKQFCEREGLNHGSFSSWKATIKARSLEVK
jgi:integrase